MRTDALDVGCCGTPTGEVHSRTHDAGEILMRAAFKVHCGGYVTVRPLLTAKAE